MAVGDYDYWHPKQPPIWPVLLLVVLILGGYAGCQYSMHGDWRCIFAECRIEKK